MDNRDSGAAIEGWQHRGGGRRVSRGNVVECVREGMVKIAACASAAKRGGKESQGRMQISAYSEGKGSYRIVRQGK